MSASVSAFPQRIESLVAHEIAHQWFGDSVTQSTWADLWLSEGFATYFAALFIEKHDGDAAFREYMRDARRRYFAYEKQRNAPIHDTQTPGLDAAAQREQLRERRVGPAHVAQAAGRRSFLSRNPQLLQRSSRSNATTEDLRSRVGKVFRQGSEEFFARWIYGAGHPVYQTSWRRTPGGSVVTINQTQSGPIFNDPIEIRLKNGNVSETKTIVPSARLTILRLRQRQRPTAIELDPDNAILKEVINR